VELADLAAYRIYLLAARMVVVAPEVYFTAARMVLGVGFVLFGPVVQVLHANSQQQTRVIYDGTLHSNS
jgi:hypothetical protein